MSTRSKMLNKQRNPRPRPGISKKQLRALARINPHEVERKEARDRVSAARIKTPKLA